MKKVSIGERIFVMVIIGLLSFFTTYLGEYSTVGAVVNGLLWGTLGAAVIFLLGKVRSNG